MGRVSCCSKVGLHKGPWSATEDRLLTEYIEAHGEGQWRSLPNKAGLLRCGKSCRLRWKNYLRPGIKRGNFTADEDDLIFRLHSLLGNRWSLIAGRLPGRTDNEIKNYWNTRLSRRRRRRLKNTEIEPTMHNDEPKKRDNHKIYIPKPIRVSSSIFGSVNDKGMINTEDLICSSWFGLTDRTDGGVQVQLFDEDDHDNLLISGCDLALKRTVPTSDNMLEKLFDEYMHLLHNDNNTQEASFGLVGAVYTDCL